MANLYLESYKAEYNLLYDSLIYFIILFSLFHCVLILVMLKNLYLLEMVNGGFYAWPAVVCSTRSHFL